MRQYKEDGWTVYGLCRKTSDELNALEVTVVEGVDVADDGCIEVLRKAFPSDVSLDLLVNNAGVLRRENMMKDAVTSEDAIKGIEGIKWQFNINALGPLRVATALVPNLEVAKGKIMNVSTGISMIADNTSGGMYGYRMSKCSLNMAGVSMSVDLKKKGISVCMVNPGMVESDMTRNMGAKAGQTHPQMGYISSAEDAVAGMRARAEELNLDNTGFFKHYKGHTHPW